MRIGSPFLSLRKMCPYSELFWTELFSPNAGKCGKNADQNNSEYGHFLRSVFHRAMHLNARNSCMKVYSHFRYLFIIIKIRKKKYSRKCVKKCVKNKIKWTNAPIFLNACVLLNTKPI